MPNDYLDQITLGNTTYDIKDSTSGYLTSSTVAAALEETDATIYEMTYSFSGTWMSGNYYYYVDETLDNLISSITSGKKVIFRQDMGSGKYNYWTPYSSTTASEINLYHFQRNSSLYGHSVERLILRTDTSRPLSESNTYGVSGEQQDVYYLNRYDVGSIIVAGTSTFNPNEHYTGTWVLIDKEFIPLASTQLDSSAITLNTTNASGLDFYYSRTGHEIAFTGYLTSKVSISNTNLEMVQSISLSSLGVSAFNFTPLLDARSDSKHAIIIMDMDKSSGRIRTLDVVVRGTDTSIATTSDITFQAVVTCHFTDMLDSACGKFYWKRTA